MKPALPVLIAIILAVVLVAGCTSTPATPATTAAPTTNAPATEATTVQTQSFTMGDHYLQKSYSFQSENDVFTEQFRVDSPSWGIEFTVLPLNDNQQYCWFVMNVTNVDTGQSESYGYGRENGYELTHQIPMYTTGPYKIVMKGNRVKVDVDVAKRNP